jgi:hypothetical protein
VTGGLWLEIVDELAQGLNPTVGSNLGGASKKCPAAATKVARLTSIGH